MVSKGYIDSHTTWTFSVDFLLVAMWTKVLNYRLFNIETELPELCKHYIDRHEK